MLCLTFFCCPTIVCSVSCSLLLKHVRRTSSSMLLFRWNPKLTAGQSSSEFISLHSCTVFENSLVFFLHHFHIVVVSHTSCWSVSEMWHHILLWDYDRTETWLSLFLIISYMQMVKIFFTWRWLTSDNIKIGEVPDGIIWQALKENNSMIRRWKDFYLFRKYCLICRDLTKCTRHRMIVSYLTFV